MNITGFSLKRPVTSLMIFLCMVVIGSISIKLLPLEFFPDISFPGNFVQIPYPGSTPEEVEKLITKPVEEVLSTISGIERMSSNSGENSAGIFILFKMDTDIDLKAIEIREKIDGIRHLLPSDLDRFTVFKFSATDDPILNLRLSSENDLSDSYDLIDRNLKQRIERLPGVSKVEFYGVDKKQIRIELLADRLAAFNVNLNQLSSTLANSNFSVTAGRITDAGLRYSVHPGSNIRGIEDLRRLPVGPGNLILSDIADIRYEAPRRNYGRHLDRKYAVGLDVYKESGANTIEVARLVENELQKVGELPQMSGIRIYEQFNQANGILSSLSELLKAGLIGALFSIIVLYLFLRQFRTTLIVALAVPFSLIVTLACLYFLGYSLNILSMMGLMLAVGMLVDNAVVITENIHRYQSMNMDRREATLKAVKEVGMAVTAGTFTSVIVFLPLVVSKQDMTAVFLEHVAVTICIALLASLLISLSIIPLLTFRVKSKKAPVPVNYNSRFMRGYGSLLAWLLGHRYTSAGLIIVIIGTVAIPMNAVKTDMFPPVEQRDIRLHYNVKGNYVLDKVKESVDIIENYLFEHQEEFEIKSVYSFYNTNYAFSTIILVDEADAKKSVSKIKELIRKDLPKLSIADPKFEFASGASGEGIQVFLNGESSEMLAELSDEALRRLSQISGFVDIRSEIESGSEEVQLVVDHNRASAFDLSAMQVASMVSSAMRGQQLRTIRTNTGEIDVFLTMQDADRQNIESLMNLPVVTPGGQLVKLSGIADYSVRQGPRTIQRQNRTTSVAINASLKDLTTNEARAEIKKVMDQINYPAGYGWSYGRSFTQASDSMNHMLINILLALILIYLVMASLFESMIYPAAIITSILFAVIGVYWFFMITGTAFDLMAMIGILILMGVVVNNGIVLIDYINQLRADGMSRQEAIITGGKHRMRPILMTAATTVLGLLPLCVGNTLIGGNGPPYYPMARAIVGGLTFSTVITMIVLPVIYVMLDDLKNWSARTVRAGTR
ncbi:MAG: efflux RND transporter permease subunit [Balneolaceae bacterium]|nr:MAG: efflux RND transporter permease subunit [Balneolaceae bacterium]